jgi:hypothetical protein
MGAFWTDKSISKQDDDRVIGFLRLTVITLASFVESASMEIASAQPSKTTHPMVKSKSGHVSGIDTIAPKEVDDKTINNGNGWNGSYVGVNAGTRFEATAGTNMVIPLGSDEK